MTTQDQNKNVYGELELLNATLIGLMIGIYEVMGRGGTQAVINMAGQYAGREMMRFARDHDQEIRSLEDFKAFVIEHQLSGKFDYHHTADTFFARIADCRTCPKKVGHYQFDGTACPWGGILTGVISEITGEKYSSAARLTPGEACVLEISKAK